jgi:hypothetical protein
MSDNVDFMSDVYAFAKKFGVSDIEEPVPVWGGNWSKFITRTYSAKEKSRYLARAHYQMAKRNNQVVNLNEKPSLDDLITLWSSVHPVLALQSKNFPSTQIRIDTLSMASSVAYRTLEQADRRMYGPTSVFFLVRRAMLEGRNLDKRPQNTSFFPDSSVYEKETASVIDQIIYRDQRIYTNSLMDGLVDTWAEMCDVVGDIRTTKLNRRKYKKVVRSIMHLRHKRKITTHGEH